MGVSRRQLIAGVGSTTAVGALAAMGTGKVAAATPADFGLGDLGDLGFDIGSSMTEATSFPEAVTLTPGLSYLAFDPSVFSPFDSSMGRVVTGTGVGIVAPPGGLVVPIALPTGAVLKEVTVSYLSTAGAATLAVFKKPLTASYAALGTPLGLPTGAASQTATLAVDSPVDQQSTHMVFVILSQIAQRVHGLLVGYTPPPQAFVPVTPVNRVLDTRSSGGKIGPGEERTVLLGLPIGARAAVVNLTITETEGAGFVAVYRADVAYPNNSSINWSTEGATTANGVISAVDAGGNIKIRGGGAGRAQVLIDVQGYLL